MNNIASAYVEGLMSKCAEYGLDPEQVVKSAATLADLAKLRKLKAANRKLPGFQQTKFKGVPDQVTKPARGAKLNAQNALAPSSMAAKVKQVAPATKKTVAPSRVATSKASKPAVRAAKPAGEATRINNNIRRSARRGGMYNTSEGRLPPDVWDHVSKPRVRLRSPEDIAKSQAAAGEVAGLKPPATPGGATAAPTAAAPTPGVTPTVVGGEAPMLQNAVVGGSGLPATAAPVAAPVKAPGMLARLGTRAAPYAIGGGIAAGGYGTYKGIGASEPFFKDTKDLTPEEQTYVDAHPEIRDTIGGGGNLIRGTRNFLSGRDMNAPWEEPKAVTK